MNNHIIIEYTKNKKFILNKEAKDMQTYYHYFGSVKDTKENWLAVVDDVQFYLMLNSGEIVKVAEANHVYQ